MSFKGTQVFALRNLIIYPIRDRTIIISNKSALLFELTEI